MRLSITDRIRRLEKKDTKAQAEETGGDRLGKISRDLPPKTELLAGSLTAYLKRCGRVNCRCAKGELHGPYYRREYQDGGVRRKKYVRKAEVERVSIGCEARKRQESDQRREILRAKREAFEVDLKLREIAKGVSGHGV